MLLLKLHSHNTTIKMGSTNSTPTCLHTPPSPPEPTIFTCEICIEPIDTNNKFKNGSLCCHPFCTDCVAKYITVKVTDDVASDIVCPGPTCQLSLDPLTCRTLLPPHTFTKWCDNLCQKVIMGLDRCYCPNRECSAMVINECGGRIRKAKCPNCKSFFCFKCGVKWHAGYKCEESRETRDQNDVVFGELTETKKWMRCPSCYHCIERVEGCNLVKCRCGTHFCYKCGKRWCICGAAVCQIFCLRFFYCIVFMLVFSILILLGGVLLKFLMKHK